MKALRTIAITLAGLCLTAMVVLTCINVFMRYFLNRPVFGAAEIVNFLLGIAVCCGLYVVAMDRGHISVSLFERFLTRHFPRLYFRLFDVMSFLGTLSVTAVLTWKTYDLITYPEETVVLRIPEVFIVGALAFLSAFAVLVTLVMTFRKSDQRAAHQHYAVE